MIKITTDNSKIISPDGRSLTGYLKITPNTTFEYEENGVRKKVYNIPIIINFVDGKIIGDLYLAPTSNAGHDKEGIYYIVEYVVGSNTYKEYWDIDGSGSYAIDITSVNQVIIDENAQIIHKCDGNAMIEINNEVLKQLDIIESKHKDILSIHNRIDSINIIDIGESYIFTDNNGIVKKDKNTGVTETIYAGYAHQYILGDGSVYGVCPFDKKIIRYEIASQQIVEIDLSQYSGTPWGICSDEENLYIGMYPECILKYNTGLSIVQNILAIEGVSRMAYYSDGFNKKIYAPQEGVGNIAIINAITMQVEKYLKYDGGSPVTYNDGTYIYLRSNNKIYKINPSEETITQLPVIING